MNTFIFMIRKLLYANVFYNEYKTIMKVSEAFQQRFLELYVFHKTIFRSSRGPGWLNELGRWI